MFKEIEALRSSEWNVLALINWNEGIAGKGKLLKYLLKYDEAKTIPKLIKSRNFLPFQAKFINKFTIWFYNKIQFVSSNNKKSVNPFSLIFMADKNRNANLWFGKKGFIEYQFSVPRESVELAIKIMRDFHKNFTIYLSGIKLISNRSVSMLNFYQNGYTITLTTTPSPILYKKLDEYDLLLSESGGRVYLPKDSRMNHENFSRMYSELSAFRSLRARLHLTIFQSDLSQRLKI
jgi:decaprenylphospho-beta-D-ribofuranose 2-oxidase